MQQQTLSVGAQTIAFYESAGNGHSVVMIHGNSSSTLSYRPQLESHLGQAHRLVAVDLPGHGASDPAADPDRTYILPGYADILVAVTEQLGLQDAVFVGWSLGGNILLEASKGLPRATGIMIIGTAPVGVPPNLAEAFLPNPAVAFNFQAELNDQEVEAFARSLFRPGADPVPQCYLSDIQRTDGRARQAIAANVQAGNYADEVAIVARLSTPLAVIYGEQEQLINRRYAEGLSMPSLWRGRVHLIPDAGHLAHWEQPAAFNRLLADFIAETTA